MPQYRVIGLDKQNQQAATIIVEAADDQEARAVGERRGIMVQRVVPTGSGAPVSSGEDSVNVVIPFKNPPALIAYYLGLFSVGCITPLGIASLILGIIGLRNQKRDPRVRGSVHAWIGIVMGVISILFWPLLCGVGPLIMRMFH